MERKITELYILTGFFCFLLIGENSPSGYEAIISVSHVIFLVLLHLSKSLIRIDKRIFGALEILFILSLKLCGFPIVEIFIPLIVYELFKFSFINLVIMFAVIMAQIIFVDGEVTFYLIYSILVNLYLYEAESQNSDKVELKRFSKLESMQKNMLQEKIANMRKYMEQKDIAASLKERNYMAQKVHDHLGHRITSAVMQLEVTKETMGKDNDMSMKYLMTAMESLRSGMEEIRGFLKNSKPGERIVSLEEIKKELLGFQYSTNIKTHLEIKGDTNKFKISQVNVILENLKEALTNAAKYSSAYNVYCSINVYNKFARIEIRDDGRGFEALNKSLGLMGMEERIEAVGGKIQFYNDDGFVINMIINF